MDKRINELISQIGKLFKEKNLSLVTAESCSGGGLAYAISKNLECSSILERGYVTYSNTSKESLLNITSELLQIQGAVSKPVAIAMGKGALANSNAQVSIAITGIAGIDRIGTKKNKKPAGLVYISCADIYGKEINKTFNLEGDRNIFIIKVIWEAANILRQYITEFNKRKKKG